LALLGWSGPTRNGEKKVVIAVAQSILAIAYHTPRDGTAFIELGADHFAHYDPEARERRTGH
jgi:hypothetical protein